MKAKLFYLLFIVTIMVLGNFFYHWVIDETPNTEDAVMLYGMTCGYALCLFVPPPLESYRD